MTTKLTIPFSWTDDEGVEHNEELPAKYEVCGRCEGHGTHLHTAIAEHAYTMEEFREEFHDDEDREAYFTRGGKYDVPCETCNGTRVVAALDEEALKTKDAGLLKRYHNHLKSEAEHEALCRMEQMMGA